MALRIEREEYYIPLPLNSQHIRSMDGVEEYFVSVSETSISACVVDELKELGSKVSVGGLVVEYNGMEKPDVNGVEGTHRVVYSIRCGLAMKSGVLHLHLTHIEPLTFGLFWEDGKFFQEEDEDEVDMNTPTEEQLEKVSNIANDLLLKHGITKSEKAHVNPFLLALIIPMAYRESQVTAFANDLFHALHMLPDDVAINAAQESFYCAFGVDEEHGNYLVFFNHPEIFNYPEDSPEGHCAYGELNQ